MRMGSTRRCSDVEQRSSRRLAWGLILYQHYASALYPTIIHQKHQIDHLHRGGYGSNSSVQVNHGLLGLDIPCLPCTPCCPAFSHGAQQSWWLVMDAGVRRKRPTWANSDETLGGLPSWGASWLDQHLRSQLVSLERPYSRPEKVGISLIV